MPRYARLVVKLSVAAAFVALTWYLDLVAKVY
jgi:hypothetical protein